ncbi:MAG: hypothetical protein ACLP8X_34040 [Streptosporangiaceae bacterium]
MTSEPRTELRAEPGQAWLQDEQVPAGQEAHVVHSGRHRRRMLLTLLLFGWLAGFTSSRRACAAD